MNILQISFVEVLLCNEFFNASTSQHRRDSQGGQIPQPTIMCHSPAETRLKHTQQHNLQSPKSFTLKWKLDAVPNGRL